jgi:hypothetical protein
MESEVASPADLGLDAVVVRYWSVNQTATHNGIFDMKYIKIMGLCLISVVLMGTAMTASAAAAGPGWFECSEVSGTGAWKNEACSEADATKKSNFERVVPVVTNFTATGGESKWEASVLGIVNVITCKTQKATGEIESSSNAGKVLLVFTGCKGEEKSSKKTCEVKSVKSEGKELISTNLLKGQLGKVAKAESSSEVGLLLAPESGTVITEIEGSCLTIAKDVIEGGLIGEVSPVGKVQGTEKLAFAIAEKKQKIQKLEGGSKEVLKLSSGIEVQVESTGEVAFEDAEIGVGEQQPAARPPWEFEWTLTVGGASMKLAAGQSRTISNLKATPAGMTIQGKVGAEAFTVKCNTLTEQAGQAKEILGGKPGKARMYWELTGCTMPTPANCTIEGTKITSKRLSGEIAEGLGRSTGKLLLWIGPSPLENFMAIKAEGANCNVRGNIEVVGSAAAEALDPATELFTQEFTFEPLVKNSVGVWLNDRVVRLPAGLYVGTEHVTITGTMTFSVLEGANQRAFSAR